MAVTIVRTSTSSQLNSLLTQASASTTYLTQVSASSTYLSQSSAYATYLPQASASSTYLTQSSASTTYAPKASPVFTGTVTKPSQPYFHVRSTQATAVGGDVLWSVIDNNIGSYYTAANGRFTAPVAGTYFFSAHGLWNNADAGDMRIALYKNAAGINGNRFILTKTASNWMTFYLNDIIYLAAGDYVTVRYLQGTNTLHVDADYNGFRGWLLG
jgi:hypothetical protein